MGQVFLTGKEAQECPALQRHVITDGAAQHRITLLERIENGPLCYRAADFDFNLVADMREQSEMLRKNNADHPSTLAVRNDLCETALPAPETAMRILNILCGMAVLFTTLALAHLIHHHAGHASSSDFHSPAFLASFVAAVAVAILSLIGGCLLIRRAR